MLFADGGRNATAVRRSGAAANCAVLKNRKILYMLFPPFVTQKVEPKCAAVKRFRGRPCACAESDAFGTFEAIKRSPILYASSPRPPFVRNRFCRGMAGASEYCSPQDCAGRSLTPAEARNGIRIVAFPAGCAPSDSVNCIFGFGVQSAAVGCGELRGSKSRTLSVLGVSRRGAAAGRRRGISRRPRAG